jgi:hypothetical protein
MRVNTMLGFERITFDTDIQNINIIRGIETPIICTPEELMEV